MSAAARALLSAFDTLPDDEREVVVTELLLRHPTGSGDPADGAFDEIADELFQSYDSAETSDADPIR